MNFKIGLVRLGVVLSVAVGVCGYFFDRAQLLDESYFEDLKKKVVLEKYSDSCKDLKIAFTPILGTNNPVYLFFGKDSDVNRMGESEFNLPIFFTDDRCENILLLVKQQSIKNPVVISNLTEEIITDYISSYRRNDLFSLIKSKVKSVLISLAYFWLAVSLLFLTFISFRWVYKGFKQ
jgi:hypothetical protein